MFYQIEIYLFILKSVAFAVYYYEDIFSKLTINHQNNDHQPEVYCYRQRIYKYRRHSYIIFEEKLRQIARGLSFFARSFVRPDHTFF